MSVHVKFTKDVAKGYATENLAYKAGDEADLAVWQVETLLAEEAIEVLTIEPEDEAKIEHKTVDEADGEVTLPAPMVEAAPEVEDPSAPAPKSKSKKAK